MFFQRPSAYFWVGSIWTDYGFPRDASSRGFNERSFARQRLGIVLRVFLGGSLASSKNAATCGVRRLWNCLCKGAYPTTFFLWKTQQFGLFQYSPVTVAVFCANFCWPNSRNLILSWNAMVGCHAVPPVSTSELSTMNAPWGPLRLEQLSLWAKKMDLCDSGGWKFRGVLMCFMGLVSVVAKCDGRGSLARHVLPAGLLDSSH